MSFEVTKAVYDRRIGCGIKKSILVAMADVAAHDGSAIWLSNSRIGRMVERPRETVNRKIREMVEAGLLIEVGRKGKKGRQTINYTLDMAALARLPLATDPVTGDHTTCDVGSHVPVTGDHTNHPNNHPSTIPPNPQGGMLFDEGEIEKPSQSGSLCLRSSGLR